MEGGGDRFPDKTRETERERLKETDGRLKREEKTAGSKGGRGGRADGEMERWRERERRWNFIRIGVARGP